jgi:hypothetical protein
MTLPKYVKKPRVVIGHGEGEMASRALDMAFKKRHAHVKFEAIDPLINVGKIKRFLGTMRKEIPSRLALTNQRILDRLVEIKSNSVDHQWAVNVVCCMPYRDIKKFYAQAFRTLKPGGRFTLVNVEYNLINHAKLLEANGFRVHLKRLTEKEMDALGEEVRLHETIAKSFVFPKDLEGEARRMAFYYNPNATSEDITYYLEKLRAHKEGKTKLVRLVATKPRGV